MDKDECCTDYLFNSRERGKALMGPAHASSGMGIFMLILGLFPTFVYFLGGGTSPILMLGMGLVFIGSSLIPDFDNTKAKIISALGFSGPIISDGFRASSKVVQSIVRTKKDDASPNPHRGFWHTIVGSLTLGGLVYLMSLISFPLSIDAIDYSTTLGNVLIFLVVLALTHVTLSVVGIDLIKKMSKNDKHNELISLVLSLVLTSLVFAFGDADTYHWVGWSIAGGMIAHILGDCLTKAGVPIFFPLPALTKGKAWWKTRFATFSADDEGLNSFISVFSYSAALIGLLLYIFHDQFVDYLQNL